jgi:hypothetical protein
MEGRREGLFMGRFGQMRKQWSVSERHQKKA